MKYLLVLVCALLLLAPTALLAKNSDKGKGKGPSPNSSAYEHASDNAKFKRGDDFQGTDGKAAGDEREDDEDAGKGKKSKQKDRDREQQGRQGVIEADDVKSGADVEVEESREKVQKSGNKKADDDSDHDAVDERGAKQTKKSGHGKGKP